MRGVGKIIEGNYFLWSVQLLEKMERPTESFRRTFEE